MIFSTVKYLERTYDDATRAKISERISPRVRGIMENINTVAWYPVADLSEIFGAIARHHEEADGKARDALVDVGRTIGETATTTFLKLIMKLLTPALFKAKLPNFWSRDHRIGTLSASLFDTNQRRLVVTLKDVGGYDFIGPVGAGFLAFALDGVFKYKNPRATFDFSMADPGPKDVGYDVTWDAS